MPNRFTDTTKWQKPWFRKLKSEHKLLWLYILDNCDHAGIWDVDIELASFMTGCDLEIEEVESAFQKQFIKVNET